MEVKRIKLLITLILILNLNKNGICFLFQQVVLKNRHIKEIIDHLRRIISEINTMLNMRRS